MAFVVGCNLLLPDCRPLLSSANDFKLSVRHQLERSKRCILDRQVRALEPWRLGMGHTAESEGCSTTSLVVVAAVRSPR